MCFEGFFKTKKSENEKFHGRCFLWGLAEMSFYRLVLFAVCSSLVAMETMYAEEQV